MLAPLVAAFTAAAVRPDPGEARAWLERELSRPEYDRSLGERFLSWLGELWEALSRAALGATPLSTGAAVLALVVLVALVLVLAGRVRREPAPVPRDRGLLVAAEASADQHPETVLAAVVAERRRRDEARLARDEALRTRLRGPHAGTPQTRR